MWKSNEVMAHHSVRVHNLSQKMSYDRSQSLWSVRDLLIDHTHDSVMDPAKCKFPTHNKIPKGNDLYPWSVTLKFFELSWFITIRFLRSNQIGPRFFQSTIKSCLGLLSIDGGPLAHKYQGLIFDTWCWVKIL